MPSGTVDSSRAREQHRAELAVAVNDPVDGLALRLEHVVEAGFDQLAVAVEELAGLLLLLGADVFLELLAA